VKKELFLEEIDAVDGRDLMNPEASKWIRISQHVMRASHSCKASGIFYIQITNELQTFMLTLVAMAWTTGSSLHWSILKDFHINYMTRYTIQAPHIWYLLSPHDSNHLGVHASYESDNEGSGESQPE
jgi:hypothetical protein